MDKIKYQKKDSKELFGGQYIIDNYISKDDNIGYSIVGAHFNNGKHPLMKNVRSSKTYYFINGNATFTVEGKIVNAEKGDIIVIPKDTKYSFEGNFDAILISYPAFDEKDDIIYG